MAGNFFVFKEKGVYLQCFVPFGFPFGETADEKGIG